MKQATISVVVYGLYLLVNGIVLLLAPAAGLALLGLAADEELWTRLFGLLAAEIGFYYVYAAHKGIGTFYRATVYGRISAATVFIGLVVAKLGPAQLLLFAFVDVSSAIWTHLTSVRKRFSDNRPSTRV